MRIRHIRGAEEYIEKSPFVINCPQEFRGKWKQEIFGNNNPLYLEVGMGMGQFIRTHASRNPEINYVGFEINSTVLYKSVRRYIDLSAADKAKNIKTDTAANASSISQAMQKPLHRTEAVSAEPASELVQELFQKSNLRFIRQDARFLAEDFALGEVDRIYLNFSDPWPKDKNENKRLTSPVFLKLYDAILKPGGKIEFKTDNEGLFDYSLAAIPAAGWKICDCTRDLHADAELCRENVMTEYEEKFSRKGNCIFRLVAER